MRLNEIHRFLRRSHFAIAEAGGAPTGHEHFHRDKFAGLQIEIRRLIAAIVDEQFVSPFMGLPQGDIVFLTLLRKQLIEPGAPQAIRVCLAVFLEEQAGGDMRPCQLHKEPFEIR
jgi:hypothetical protein